MMPTSPSGTAMNAIMGSSWIEKHSNALDARTWSMIAKHAKKTLSTGSDASLASLTLFPTLSPATLSRFQTARSSLKFQTSSVNSATGPLEEALMLENAFLVRVLPLDVPHALWISLAFHPHV